MNHGDSKGNISTSCHLFINSLCATTVVQYFLGHQPPDNATLRNPVSTAYIHAQLLYLQIIVPKNGATTKKC